MAADAFTNTNGTTLPTHNANWSHCAGGNWGRIYSNGAASSAWDEGGYRYTGSNGDTSQATLKALAAGNNASRGRPCVRMGSSNSGYAAGFVSPSGGNWQTAYAFKNGAWLATIGSVSVSQGSDHVIKLTASGTTTVTLELFVDGVSVGTAVDSTSAYSSGLSGIYLIGDANNDVPLLDDWSDGAVAAATSFVIPSQSMIRSILAR